MNTAAFSPRRTFLIARLALIEASRQRLPALLCLGAIGSILAIRTLEDFNFGLPPLKFVGDLGQGAIASFGSVLAITVSTQFFFSEIDQRTLPAVLAKPVARAEFLLGKYLAALLLLASFCLLATTLLVTLLSVRGMAWWPPPLDISVEEQLPTGLGLALMAVGRWLELGVLSAFTFLLASFSTVSLGATLQGFGVMAVGHLQFLVRPYYTDVNSSPLHLMIGRTIQILPDFGLFDLTESAMEMDSSLLASLARSAVCAALYAITALGLAVVGLRRREV